MGFVEVLTNKILSGIAFPSLVRVEKVNFSGGYSIDGIGVDPETFRETGELFKEIPLSPIWAASDGRGIYAPPSIGQIVVVAFVHGSKAYPFVAGVYGETYRPNDTPPKKECKLMLTDSSGRRLEIDADERRLILTDGAAAIEIDQESRIIVKNGFANLKEILDGIIEAISTLQTSGSVSLGGAVLASPLPATTAMLERLRTDKVAKLLKE